MLLHDRLAAGTERRDPLLTLGQEPQMQYMHIFMHVQFKVPSSSPTIDSHRSGAPGQRMIISVATCVVFSSSVQNIQRCLCGQEGM